jgi:polyisoprenoid-binding protein YceI
MLLRLLAVLLVLPTLASAATWRIDPGTYIIADVLWRGASVAVNFPPPSGTISFDPDRPELARAELTVSAQAATTGVGPVDALVRSEGYLDSARHPRITFNLDRLIRTSSSTADVEGRMTLRGVTRPVRFSARVVRYGPAADDATRFEAGFDLTGSLDRTEFGSTGGLPEVPARLPIRIRLLMSSQ